VLITGAGSGIGLESALAFARQGCTLILVDLSLERLAEVQPQVQALGANCEIHAVDVADAHSMQQLAEQVHREFGALDVLVNNAGIAFLGSFVCTPLSAWSRSLSVNIMGVVHGCHFFLPRMLEAGGARHIVNVASAAAFAPTVNMGAYAATKHAVMGLTDTLMQELWDSKVRVSAVCPGVINTPIVRPSAGSVGSNITSDQLQKLSAYYQRTGAHPSVVATAIVQAVQRGQGLVLVGPYAKLAFHLKRVSRALLTRVTLADSKKMGYR
jgi:short-subunit dehydrogenase